MAALKGGDKLTARLNQIAANLAKASSVDVGFMAGSTEPDGTSTALGAALNEYGGTINVAAGETTIYRMTNAAGTGFLRKGRFVKASKSNFASTHTHEAYTITRPPRPFFRNAIVKNQGQWPADIAASLKANNYDAKKALNEVGQKIQEEIQDSIVDLTSPPLAASTIARKSRGRVSKMAGVLGPAKPLVDSGTMLRSPTHLVK